MSKTPQIPAPWSKHGSTSTTYQIKERDRVLGTFPTPEAALRWLEKYTQHTGLYSDNAGRIHLVTGDLSRFDLAEPGEEQETR